jgi:hypothetical protein
MPVKVGYLGSLDVDGSQYRCTAMSSSPQQSVMPYKHVIGLNDTVTASDTKGESVGAIQPQKNLWRPSMELITGSFSLLLEEDKEEICFEQIKRGNYIDGGIFDNCKSLDINVQNEIIPIYTIDNDGFSDSPFGVRDLRIGTQNVSGTCMVYDKPSETPLDLGSEPIDINVSVNSLSIDLHVVLTPLQVSSSAGVFTAGVAFTGIGNALGS